MTKRLPIYLSKEEVEAIQRKVSGLAWEEPELFEAIEDLADALAE